MLSLFACAAVAKPQTFDDFNAQVENDLGPVNVSSPFSYHRNEMIMCSSFGYFAPYCNGQKIRTNIKKYYFL